MITPVFIVGIPRSGTTLLAALFAAHSRMSCGPETHFFSRLSQIDVDQLLYPDTWPGRAVNFIDSITHTSFNEDRRKPLLEKYHLDRGQIYSYLVGCEPSIGVILASVTEQYMRAKGKSRWVEKTPDHIKHLKEIRKYFPDSPIIRIIRDPRDIALSLTKMPWGTSSFNEGLLLWKSLDEISSEFFSHDKNSYTLRFEDLVTRTEQELRTLCEFIGEEFEPQMLDTSSTGKEINSRNVPWKDKVSEPIDPSRVALWRTEISKSENQFAEALLGDRLGQYKYQRVENLNVYGEFYPSSNLSVKYACEIEQATSSGVRFWSDCDGERPSLRVYLGDPGDLGWLSGTRFKKMAETAAVAFDIVKTLITKNKSIVWIPDHNVSSNWTGYSAFLLKKLLSPYQVIQGK